MSNKQKKGWIWGLILAVIITVGPVLYNLVIPTFMNPSTEEVRKKIKNHLYEKYGEEFMVDRIGTQTANGDTDYVARIYPKSIVGTKKEGDEYYYAKAGVDKKSFGRLGGVGDGYGTVKMNMEAEKYLMPKIKEIFGKRVLAKVEVGYYKKDESGYFGHYLVHGFKEKLKKVKADPKNKRLELELYVYVFDRIEDKVEKEKRRKDVFEFVQYLKDEGLFEYLKVGVAFIDERVLAPSYDKYDKKVYYSDKVKKKVDGETVYLPPVDLRKKMSKSLQNEIKNMSKEKIIANMKKIKKGRLTYEEMREYNGQYYCWVYSPKMKRLKCNVKETKELRSYNHIEDVVFEEYDKYIFLN